ncbi:MAG: hypothetical protein ACE5GA_06835 [Candidatus Zixiibacteriota bacterium]
MKRNVAAVFIPLCIVAFAIARAGTPEHPHKVLKRDCEACHTTESFAEIRFDHEHVGFPLEGNHAISDCRTCHTIEDFSKTERSCLNCHQDVHEAKLGSNCLECHSLKGWTKFDFDKIHLNTEYPMMGQHATIDCESCHKSLPRGDMSFGVTRCIECHQQDFLDASSPQHVASGFSTECLECHQMNHWEPATLADHDAVFPIFAGVHNGKWDACVACHTVPGNNSQFSCVTCHEHSQQLMDNTHLNAVPGYVYASESCYSCHPDGSKSGAVVDHDASFPIFSGTHNGKWDACGTCHSTGAGGTSFTCLNCHQHNQAAVDLTHQGIIPGYTYTSAACYDCHPDGKRTGLSIDHDALFPIFSGTHSNQWDGCGTCHGAVAGGAAFTCLNCHQHNQTAVDITHQGIIPGYSYASEACYGCHPDGQRASAAIDHGAFFPINSGVHAGQWDACTTCHGAAAGGAPFTCFECHTHNQLSMDNVHQGRVPGYSYASSACFQCHPDGKTSGASIDHDPIFPIFSGPHQGKWIDCATCHDVAGEGTLFTCFNCHKHDQLAMDDKHKDKPDYSYESRACYNCHPGGKA